VSAHRYIACDLGTESGRVMLGTLADGKLTLEQLHRFPNGPIAVHDTLRWDVLRLFALRSIYATSQSEDALVEL
jgi:hypothetical protein